MLFHFKWWSYVLLLFDACTICIINYVPRNIHDTYGNVIYEYRVMLQIVTSLTFIYNCHLFIALAKNLFYILYFSGLPWNIFWSLERTLNANKCQHPTGLHHPLEGITNPNYKLLSSCKTWLWELQWIRIGPSLHRDFYPALSY